MNIAEIQLSPVQPVAEVKVKMTGGNVGIATIIQEIYDPFREPLQAGDKLYTAPPQRPWVGLTKQDMPSGGNPMFDHQYFIAGMVYAAKVLQAKNT